MSASERELVNICRRCKREFTPTSKETRCKTCLDKRRANRSVKRKEAKESETRSSSIERMMRSNGDRKGISHVRMHT